MRLLRQSAVCGPQGKLPEAIHVLDQFFEAGVSISAVHIAYECDVREDIDRRAFAELLNYYTTQRYRRAIDEGFPL